jgi:hypothetical protein
VLNRAGAVQHQVADDDARGRLPGQKETGEALAGGTERLQALLGARHVGDDESAVARRVESGGLNDPARLEADLQQFPRRRACSVDGMDRVTAPVEDEVRAVGRLLKLDGLFERADDVRRQAADRLQDVRGQRRRSGGQPGEKYELRAAEQAHDPPHYAAWARMALRTSPEPGRITSSRTGA